MPKASKHLLWVVYMLHLLSFRHVRAQTTPAQLRAGIPLKVFYRAQWYLLPGIPACEKSVGNRELLEILENTLRDKFDLRRRKIQISIAPCNASHPPSANETCLTNTIRLDESQSGPQGQEPCVEYPLIHSASPFTRLKPATKRFSIRLCDLTDKFTVCHRSDGVFAKHHCIHVFNRSTIDLQLHPGWNNISVHADNTTLAPSARSVYVEPMLAGSTRPKPFSAASIDALPFEEVNIISLNSNLEHGWQRILREEIPKSKLIGSQGIRLFEGVLVEPGLAPLERLVDEGVLDASTMTAILDQETRHTSVAAVNLTRGAIGCALSHIALWRRAVSHNISVLILEDDVIVSPDFDDILQRLGLSRLMGQLNASLFYLGMPPYLQGHSRRSVPLSDLPQVRHLVRDIYGTYAYIATPAGAHTLLEGVLPLRMQLDSWISARIAQGDILALGLDPSVVIEVKSLRESSVQTGT